MILYHCTTKSKIERYEKTGAIIPPVRSWKWINSAKEWNKKTGRNIILEIECNESYPLPDHKPLYHSYWTPEYIRSWKIIENCKEDLTTLLKK